MANDAEAHAPVAITNFRPAPILAIAGGTGLVLGLAIIVLAADGVYDALLLTDVPIGAYLEGLTLVLMSSASVMLILTSVKTPAKLIVDANGIEVRRTSAMFLSGAPHVRNIPRERIACMKANKVVQASASEGSSHHVSYTVVFANKDGERVGTIETLASTEVVNQLASALNVKVGILDEA
jgi:hypothetical protein